MKPKNENSQASKQNHLKNLDDKSETQEKNENVGPIEGEIDVIAESENTDTPEKDDDQWLYLPALRKTKRIASSDKSGSFMGSDFSYADMTDRPLEKYEYQLLKEGELDGHPVWIIQSTPVDDDEIDETGYTKSVQFVRKDNYVVIQAKIWVKKGKRNKYMKVEELEQIDGIWVPTVMTMTTKKGKQTLHKTILRTSDVKFGQDLDFDMFSVRGLETGP